MHISSVSTLALVAILSTSLVLSGCNASTPIQIADVAITGVIAGAQASGATEIVGYGQAALKVVSCIGAEVNSSDTAAKKSVIIGTCAAEIAMPIVLASTYAAAITAALQIVVEAYGGHVPAMLATTPGVAAVRAAHPMPAHRALLQDGRPSLFERMSVNRSIARANAHADAAARWIAAHAR